MKYYILLALLLLTKSCGSPPGELEIIVDPQLKEQEQEIITDTKEAIKFFFEYYDLDYDTYTAGLTIEIIKDPVPIGKCIIGDKEVDCVAMGRFKSFELIVEVVWLGGSHRNALLHELLHYKLFTETNYSDYDGLKYEVSSGHTMRFLDEVKIIKNKWQELKTKQE